MQKNNSRKIATLLVLLSKAQGVTHVECNPKDFEDLRFHLGVQDSLWNIWRNPSLPQLFPLEVEGIEVQPSSEIPVGYIRVQGKVGIIDDLWCIATGSPRVRFDRVLDTEE